MSHAATPILALLLAATASPVAAQNVKDEIWPELDVYAQLGTRLRLTFVDSFNQDQNTRYRQGSFNYLLEYAMAPFFRRDLRDREDVFRRRFLTFRIGYQYTTSLVNGDSSSENRYIADSTAKFPLPGKFVVTDRNRGEFRFVKGQPFSMRYRNKVMLERDLRLGRLVFTPYGYDEVFYDTRDSAWVQNRYGFGLQIPVGPHLVVEPYSVRQHNQRSTPQLVNALGLTINLYF